MVETRHVNKSLQQNRGAGDHAAVDVARPLPAQEGRVVIEAMSPAVDGGAFAVKRVIGDVLVCTADIFSDGHEQLSADLVVERPDGVVTRTPMQPLVNDRWRAAYRLDAGGAWSYTIEAWRDPFASWAHDVRKKIAAARDRPVDLSEGLAIVRGAAQTAPEVSALDDLLEPAATRFMRDFGPRRDIACSQPMPLRVERRAARFSAWYELFPRSQSQTPGAHGTLRDVIERLPEIAELGFDVLYFPPIHPIGERNRKGRNNALTTNADDPGSVYAIGSRAGGHDAIHPQLGELEDFRALVAAARAHGVELALDFAVQCSPDHPWLTEHPDWFERRADGSMRYAENPPKTYEDIVNVKFDGSAFPAAWEALRDIVLFWVREGVAIFRVDNPHTKPLPFWRWLISEVNATNPDVLFLAEAFTRPAMMRRLAKIGFQQSYTYFTWRNTKREIEDYITELAGEMGEYYRPNFFVNTPDINPFYLQGGGRAGFVVRATLAATLSSNFGIYSGFEFCEAAAVLGREEYIDSEKYQLRDRRTPGAIDIRPHLRALNTIRRANPALQDFRNCIFLNAWHEQIIAYVRMTPARDNCILVIVNLDPHHTHECHFEAPLWEFGLADTASIEVEDLLLGASFTLTGKIHWIRLDPAHRSVVIWRLIAPARMEARA